MTIVARTVARAAVLAAVVAGALLAVGVAPAGGAEVASSCLDGVRLSHSCPSVAVTVAVGVTDTTLVVRVTNTSGATWRGGPVGVEVPLPGAAVDQPEGTIPAPAGSGWRTVGGTVVARCAFIVPGEAGLRPGGTATCVLPRLGAPDGRLTAWITGFRGGVADAGRRLGAETAPIGVIPVATMRSLRFRVHGRSATVLPSPAIDAAAPSVGLVRAPDVEPGSGSHRWAIAAGALAAIGVGVAGAWGWRARARRAVAR